MRTELPDIRQCSESELTNYFASIGENVFRTKQLMEWLWKRGAISFEEMTNLPLSLRKRLTKEYAFPSLQIDKQHLSKDGTKKFLFTTNDGKKVESVLIPSRERVTACLSTQVGCAMACRFCATAQMGLQRQLTVGEILDQVFLLQKAFGRKRLSNIVFMGMGEPLANYAQTIASLRRIIARDGLGFSPQRITVSTCGLPKFIKKFANEGLKIPLAVSLHAAEDTTRSLLMPINKQHNLKELKRALIHFHRVNGLRITLEYLLLDKINDRKKDGNALIAWTNGLPCKINLLPYNPILSLPYRASSEQATEQFKQQLEQAGMIVTLRTSRGKDIQAACGQLATLAPSP